MPVNQYYYDYVNVVDQRMQTDNVFSPVYVKQILEARDLILNDILKDAGCKKFEDLETKLCNSRSITKNMLADWLKTTMDLLHKYTAPVLTNAADLYKNYDDLKMNCISDQRKIIDLQEKILVKKEEEIQSAKTAMQDTVKTEIKSYSTVLKNTCTRVLAPKRVQAALKTAAEEEERGKNLIIYGLEEKEEERLEEEVLAVLSHLDEKPRIVSCERLGSKTDDEEPSIRPVKLSLSGIDHTRQILKKTQRLKDVSGYTTVYICPDRTADQRKENKKLVEELKKRRVAEPDKKHYIRKNTVHSCDISHND